MSDVYLKRDQYLHLRLNKDEQAQLSRHASFCGMTNADYVRKLISGYVPKVAPPYNYLMMTKELRSIGGNMNQIAKVANAERIIDAEKYKVIASHLFQKIDEIEKAVGEPISLEDYPDGNL